MNSATLNLNRLGHLILNDLRLNKKMILIVALTLIVFFALMPFHVTGTASVYFAILYIGGFIITSSAFNDLHQYPKAYLSLMLPCSNLERFLSKWLLTSIGYALGVLIIYYLFSLISVAVNILLIHRTIYPLDILQPTLWIGIGKYIILQSIVLLGAITFKRYALIKTALAIGCFFLALGFLSTIIAWIFFPNYFPAWTLLSNAITGSYFFFWIILAPFCWYITYLRITEYELS